MYYHGNWISSAADTAGVQDGFSTAFRHAKHNSILFGGACILWSDSRMLRSMQAMLTRQNQAKAS